MDYFVFRNREYIPEVLKEDVSKLQEFIQSKMHIVISALDTYRLWKAVSDYEMRDWLPIEEATEEFILDQMHRYGYVMHN